VQSYSPGARGRGRPVALLFYFISYFPPHPLPAGGTGRRGRLPSRRPSCLHRFSLPKTFSARPEATGTGQPDLRPPRGTPPGHSTLPGGLAPSKGIPAPAERAFPGLPRVGGPAWGGGRKPSGVLIFLRQQQRWPNFNYQKTKNPPQPALVLGGWGEERGRSPLEFPVSAERG